MQVFLLLVLLTVTLVFAFDPATMQMQTWANYKARFGKKYTDATEENGRYSAWQKNRAIIDNHNANAHRNLLWEKTNSLTRLGTIIPPGVAPLPFNKTASRQIVLASQPGTSLDYRSSDCMPPVKDQGFCSSCWAFAATCPLEFLTCKATGSNHPVVLSESQLLNCSYAKGTYGCAGGFFTKAWDYIKAAPGLGSASKLPYYPAASRKCAYTSSMKAATLSSYVQLPVGDVAQIMESLTDHGPLAACMFGLPTSLPHYTSGIYSDPLCPTTGVGFNHAVVIVGYGTSGNIDYWIVRNSWGPNWGDHGYFLIQRGVNMCNIESLVFHVTL